MHKLYLRFENCLGWRVNFRDLGDERKQFREFTFADSAKIEQLIGRTATPMRLEDHQLFRKRFAGWCRHRKLLR